LEIGDGLEIYRGDIDDGHVSGEQCLNRPSYAASGGAGNLAESAHPNANVSGANEIAGITLGACMAARRQQVPRMRYSFHK